jgi:hypothetical protein
VRTADPGVEDASCGRSPSDSLLSFLVRLSPGHDACTDEADDGGIFFQQQGDGQMPNMHAM